MEPKRRLVLLAVIGLLLLRVDAVKSAQSCQQPGPVVLPCADQLELDEWGGKFLFTLFGHSCYHISLASDQPFDAFLDDANSFTRLRSGKSQQVPLASTTSANHNTTVLTNANPTISSNTINTNGKSTQSELSSKLCGHATNCVRKKHSVSRHSLFSLMISQRHVDEPSDQRLRPHLHTLSVRLESCDAVPFWFRFFLFGVSCIGFISFVLAFFCIGERVLHLRSVSRARKSLGHIQFIELIQIKDSQLYKAPSSAVVANATEINDLVEGPRAQV